MGLYLTWQREGTLSPVVAWWGLANFSVICPEIIDEWERRHPLLALIPYILPMWTLVLPVALLLEGARLRAGWRA